MTYTKITEHCGPHPNVRHITQGTLVCADVAVLNVIVTVVVTVALDKGEDEREEEVGTEVNREEDHTLTYIRTRTILRITRELWLKRVQWCGG